MPRQSLAAAVTRPVIDGVEMAAAVAGNATDNNVVTNTGRTLILAENTGVGARVLTIVFSKTVQGQAVDPMERSIPAGETWLFGEFPVADFGRELMLNPAHAEITFQVIQP